MTELDPVREMQDCSLAKSCFHVLSFGMARLGECQQPPAVQTARPGLKQGRVPASWYQTPASTPRPQPSLDWGPVGVDWGPVGAVWRPNQPIQANPKECNFGPACTPCCPLPTPQVTPVSHKVGRQLPAYEAARVYLSGFGLSFSEALGQSRREAAQPWVEGAVGHSQAAPERLRRLQRARPPGWPLGPNGPDGNWADGCSLRRGTGRGHSTLAMTEERWRFGFL